MKHCTECGGPIKLGALVVINGEDYAHVNCPPEMPMEQVQKIMFAWATNCSVSMEELRTATERLLAWIEEVEG